jgi:hypothetical protein
MGKNQFLNALQCRKFKLLSAAVLLLCSFDSDDCTFLSTLGFESSKVFTRHHQFTQLAPKTIADNMVECILREQKFEPNICLQGGLMFAISMFLVLKNEQHEY